MAGIWNNLTNDEDGGFVEGTESEKTEVTSSTRRKRRKTPLLDLNLEDHINDTSEPSTSGISKRPKLDIMSALIDAEKEVDESKLLELEKEFIGSRSV